MEDLGVQCSCPHNLLGCSPCKDYCRAQFGYSLYRCLDHICSMHILLSLLSKFWLSMPTQHERLLSVNQLDSLGVELQISLLNGADRNCRTSLLQKALFNIMPANLLM
jgi:hypothetical protein